MILVSRDIRYMRIFTGVPRGGESNVSGVVEERNFHPLLLAICSETLDRICRIYTVGHKKRATFIFTITLASVDRFQ